ncbi:MAG: hypothetical protein IPF98_13835 [Gemmatimonadetes bacterium]|nr:hypothetical protein [Gemmatimonadota bacterium]
MSGRSLVDLHCMPAATPARRRRALRAVAFAGALCALAAPRTLTAQGAGPIDPQCRAGTTNERITQDACQKAIDLLQFMAPQLGMALTGGNAVSGEHSALRGLGHLSIGLKVNALEAGLPRVDQRTPSTTGASSSDYGVRSQWVPVPVVDAAIGLFRGIPFAGTYALGVDMLVNLAVLPSVDETDLSVELPDGSAKVGFGARLGLLAETFVTPGISMTWLQRELPTVNVKGRVSGDELDVRNVRVSTSAWRLVAGKNFSVFGVALGGGQDTYETRADAQVTINRVGPGVTSNVVTGQQDLTRNNLFGNVALNLPALRVVAEVGRVTGGSVATYNTFDGHKADDARTYASIALRVNW